jgi:hypothetical protein
MGSKLEQNEQELTDRCVEMVKKGCPRSTAAACAGITLATFNRYMRKGAEGKQPYKRFSRALDEAEAQLKASGLAHVLQAGMGRKGRNGDWRAMVEFLKLRFPEEFANREAGCEKDLDRLLDIMAERLNAKQFMAVLNEWDGRRTYED